MNDLISRQDAIDAKQEFRNPNVVRSTEARTAYDRTYANGWNDCNSAWIDAINALSAAQPDLSEYSDKLWRSAYERGKRDAQSDLIYCKNCEYLDVQGTYGECGKGILGIVNREDFCSRAERRKR